MLPISPNIYSDQWETIVIYRSNTLLVIIQLCSPHRWHLDSNYCRTRGRQSHPRFVLPPLLLLLLGTFQSDIRLFTLTWPAKHSPNQAWESTYRLHLYSLGGVFYSPASIEHISKYTVTRVCEPILSLIWLVWNLWPSATDGLTLITCVLNEVKSARSTCLPRPTPVWNLLFFRFRSTWYAYIHLCLTSTICSCMCNITNSTVGWVYHVDKSTFLFCLRQALQVCLLAELSTRNSSANIEHYLVISWWRHQVETFSPLLAFCAGIHRWPVNSPHKGQRRGALMFSFICAWING